MKITKFWAGYFKPDEKFPLLLDRVKFTIKVPIDCIKLM